MNGIAVAGAGMIGKRHLAALRIAGLPVHSVIDPDPATAAIAAEFGVPHYESLDKGLEAKPAGVVVATPNVLHPEGAMACISAQVPVLIEKPITTELADAVRIVEAGEAANVPVLTGQHRRHLPVVRAAKERIDAGALGTLVAAHAMFWISKPDDYFETPWRRSKGAGPILMNAIHDLDLLRYLLGEVESVRAVQTNRIRNHEIEDACAALLTFESGVICTLQISDAVVSPWSFELTAHDNPAYPPTDQNALFIGGTHGSLSLPRGEEWSDGGKRDWWQPIARTTLLRGGDDPLVAQLENFTAVIRGEEAPVCSGREGMKSLAALVALRDAAQSGKTEVPEV
ncbi:Gfo/Idh/MocA family oxidoreductase [Rhizobiales bacterium]|uniref:Gfo/Idh/MocA family protein n=1 Tax=Hongsoonwoonella zoysiae TaxID=2821844 RepID=UPI0015616182|nr:Gfo/Idh/MocA family oxidoreductase [Hongsoonwoonella zoysiae]NRG18208.1 Gfo/Idh/MocA family oxidoreductase [Hongsoonwoonella zoysiae]